jgi:hypothetical protein
MALDQDTIDREFFEEEASMARQRRVMIDEIEDINVVLQFEHAEDDEYRMALGTYEQSLQLLNISDRTSFPFLNINPISLGRAKEDMYMHLYPTMTYSKRKLLYVTQAFEYYVDGQRFNKQSRRWSYFPDHLHGLLWSLCKIRVALDNV